MAEFRLESRKYLRIVDSSTLQAEIHQKRYEQERRALKLRVSELENKLEVLTQDLEKAESTIESKTSDMLMLQNNLKELEELREMKEVFGTLEPSLSFSFCFYLNDDNVFS